MMRVVWVRVRMRVWMVVVTGHGQGSRLGPLVPEGGVDVEVAVTVCACGGGRGGELLLLVCLVVLVCGRSGDGDGGVGLVDWRGGGVWVGVFVCVCADGRFMRERLLRVHLQGPSR